MLIISSDDLLIYNKLRTISIAYHSEFTGRIKHFFVELKPDIEEDVREDGCFIYVKGIESVIPGIYIKTIYAMRYINSKYNYKHIIRTNVSSFWNLPNLLKYQEKLPIVDFAGGILHGHTIVMGEPTEQNVILFASGTGIFMSKDVAERVSEKIYTDKLGLQDDVLLGIILQMCNYCLFNIGYDKWNLLIDNSESITGLNDDYCITGLKTPIEKLI